MNINEIVKELKEKYLEMEIELAENTITPNKRSFSELTKEDLKKMGVVDVDFENLIVYGKKGPLKCWKNYNGYLIINVYDIDENGERIKIPRISKYRKKDGTIGEYTNYNYKIKHIGLHRILWVWRHGIVHKGNVVDHINNKHTNIEDYRLDNLQEITPFENLSKERINFGTKTIKVVKDNMLDYYLNKLEQYIKELEIAKAKQDTRKSKNLSSNISYIKSKLRYLYEEIEKKENF